MNLYRSRTRKRLDLAGIWEFNPTKQNRGAEDQVPADRPPEHFPAGSTMLLPGCWNTQQPDRYYHSAAWVRREVFVPADWPEECWLFCGIHSWSLELWVNDAAAGEHTGYLSHWFPVRLRPGELNVIALRLDAAERDDRIGTRFDVNNPGGVFGRMVLEARERSYIDRVTVRTAIGDGAAQVTVAVEVTGRADTLTLSILDEHQSVASRTVALDQPRSAQPHAAQPPPAQAPSAQPRSAQAPPAQPPSAQPRSTQPPSAQARSAQARSVVEETFTLKQPRLWKPDTPDLYTLDATLAAAEQTVDQVSDQVSLDFGVRTVAVNEHAILLNGEPQSIRGMLTFNDHPDTSRYLPTHIILKDFWIAKHANVNAWRHHYPASQEFLELADRYGFLVIESVPLVWNDNLGNPAIVRQAKEQLREMIERGRNHPCIIGWGIWNELGVFHDWYSDEEYKEIVKQVTRELLLEAERLDPTRFALFATGLILDEPCLELEEAKVLGINLYPRVYDPDIWKTNDPLQAEVNKGVEVLEFVRKRYPKKPILMTEFGWQTIPGLRDFRHGNWSEDYQDTFIRKLLPEMQRIGVAGFLFSCYADWMTRPVMKAPIEAERPGELGYWGMLDQYRRPKLVYNTVKELYGKMHSDEANEA